jgi:hypothetical protein
VNRRAGDRHLDERARHAAARAETVSTSADVAATLDEAVVAYTGHRRTKIPTADVDAVLALTPTAGAVLLEAVREAIRLTDTISFDDVAPFDAGLRGRLLERVQALLPDLGPTGVEALAWRWGYVNLR